MKKYFVLAILLIYSLFTYCQNTQDPSDALKFYYLDGIPIKMDNVFNSEYDVFNTHFSEYKLSGSEYDKVSSEQGDYEIIYQTFSYKPLFLIGDLTKKDLRNLKKVIESFNQKYRYREINIDNNYLIENDIKNAIELKLVDMFFLKTLGKPDSSYKNSDGYKVYTYKGIKKSFDLIFKNGIVTDYSIFNSY